MSGKRTAGPSTSTTAASHVLRTARRLQQSGKHCNDKNDTQALLGALPHMMHRELKVLLDLKRALNRKDRSTVRQILLTLCVMLQQDSSLSHKQWGKVLTHFDQNQKRHSPPSTPAPASRPSFCTPFSSKSDMYSSDECLRSSSVSLSSLPDLSSTRSQSGDVDDDFTSNSNASSTPSSPTPHQQQQQQQQQQRPLAMPPQREQAVSPGYTWSPFISQMLQPVQLGQVSRTEHHATMEP